MLDNIIITKCDKHLPQSCEMPHVPLRAIDEEMSSLREVARVASLTETSAIDVIAQKIKARKNGFIVFLIPIVATAS